MFFFLSFRVNFHVGGIVRFIVSLFFLTPIRIIIINMILILSWLILINFLKISEDINLRRFFRQFFYVSKVVSCALNNIISTTNSITDSVRALARL